MSKLFGTLWKVIKVLVTLKTDLPDKDPGQSDTIKGAGLAGIITIIVSILPGLGVNLDTPLAKAIITVAYSIAGLLVVVGVRGVAGTVVVGLDQLNSSQEKTIASVNKTTASVNKIESVTSVKK